jgi:hypothetical protein
MEFIAKILRKNPSCEGPRCVMRALDVVVDPVQFKNHGIAKVPALVMEPNFDFQSYCEKGATASGTSVPVVYGDASLRSLLERLTTMNGGTPAKRPFNNPEFPIAERTAVRRESAGAVFVQTPNSDNHV